MEEASEIDIKVARMEEGAKLALEADGQGYHVLVSRGVTDWIIRELADTIEEGALHF
ncbi:MAG: PrpR N-terminal domain-containing protein [Desulfosporosinus sp.]|nr:PrpR N-terminal domain-containing protein [Desulfosporosinus sp.]